MKTMSHIITQKKQTNSCTTDILKLARSDGIERQSSIFFRKGQFLKKWQNIVVK